MGRIVRLTERDLTRLVRRVIREQKGGTHSAMVHLANELEPDGFIKTNNAGATLGPNGEFNGLSKGTDESGAYIYDSSLNNKIQLIVTINRDVIVNKEYKKTGPDYTVDSKQILDDLGKYKTWEFKKPPYRG